MLGSPLQRKPTFLWQGVLILLPVVMMSAVGLVAIRRDKASVEQEARQRAAELVNQLATGLAKRLPARLADYDLFSLLWLKHYSDLAKTDFPPPDAYAARLAQWQAANPDLRPEEVLPNRLSFTRNGVLIWPVPYNRPPQAPVWFVGLTPEQRQAWNDLVNAETVPADETNANLKLREFLNTSPPPEGRDNADFIWLRTRLAHEIGLNAVLALQRASVDYHSVSSESGLPLLSLAAAEVLRLVRQSGEAQKIFLIDANDQNAFRQLLAWILNEPSMLSPMLLEELQALVDSHAIAEEKFQQPIRAAQTIWSTQQRLHDLSEILPRHCSFNASAVTNFWLHGPFGTWFCRAEPDRLTFSARNAEDILVRETNDVTSVHVYPKKAVESAFAKAIQDLAVSVPDYLDVNVRLEQEQLELRHARTPAFEAIPSGPGPLGSKRTDQTARYYLTGPVESLTNRTGFASILAEARLPFAPVPISSIADLPSAGPARPVPESEDMANRPQFIVQISLANPQLLFARQRQRTWLFVGLILASSIAALVGLLAAYRSFRRQLRLSELKSNFVSSVSHELRAPIASVRLMAESLERGKITDSRKQHEYFHFIVQECRRLSSLIENVLDFSRIEQGRKQLEFESTNIIALVEQTVKLMEPYAAERQVALTLALGDFGSSDAHLQLQADGKAIQQALVNLIDNAVKHSPKGQAVKVGLEVRNVECGVGNQEREPAGGRPGGSRVALWVEDCGEGIPAEEHEKIFERFYRLGSELRRQTQGVGIGLSIVKHVVEAHGGRVLVRSAPGQGSRFTIELPVAAEAPKSETRNPKAE